MIKNPCGFQEIYNSTTQDCDKLAVKETFDSKISLEYDNVEVLQEPIDCISNHWLISLRFKHDDVMRANQFRLQVITECHSQGVLVRPH